MLMDSLGSLTPLPPTLTFPTAPGYAYFDAIMAPPKIPPDRRCLTRIQRDHAALTNDPVDGIVVHPDDQDNTLAHAIIQGPKDTPYEGG